VFVGVWNPVITLVLDALIEDVMVFVGVSVFEAVTEGVPEIDCVWADVPLCVFVPDLVELAVLLPVNVVEGVPVFV
jgi:hypothetical protein